MEVWILYGDDIESNADLAHEVRRFKAEAETSGITLKVYNPANFDLIVDEQTRDSVLINGKPVPLPDVVYPYFNHNDHSYFSLAIVRQLERMGCLVYNKAETIEMVRDKLHTHQVLAEKGITSPTTMLAKFPVDDDMVDMIERTLGFPVIVKTLKGALGVGVFLIEDAKAFKNQMDLIGQTAPDIQLIFQKFVAASKGRDLRLFVVDGELVASMERRAKEGDFKANYSGGGARHPDWRDRFALQAGRRLHDLRGEYVPRVQGVGKSVGRQRAGEDFQIDGAQVGRAPQGQEGRAIQTGRRRQATTLGAEGNFHENFRSGQTVDQSRYEDGRLIRA